jgi:hypothetical protein
MHTKKVVKKECCGPESVQCGSGSNFLGQNGSGSSSGLNSDDGTDTPVLYVQYTIIPLRCYLSTLNLKLCDVAYPYYHGRGRGGGVS